MRKLLLKFLRYLLDWAKGRVYYVVRMSDPGNPWQGNRDVAICDCGNFGGADDYGIFKYHAEAHAFAAWREHRADYGRGFVYTVSRATDEELDEYLNDMEQARG